MYLFHYPFHFRFLHLPVKLDVHCKQSVHKEYLLFLITNHSMYLKTKCTIYKTDQYELKYMQLDLIQIFIFLLKVIFITIILSIKLTVVIIRFIDIKCHYILNLQKAETNCSSTLSRKIYVDAIFVVTDTLARIFVLYLSIVITRLVIPIFIICGAVKQNLKPTRKKLSHQGPVIQKVDNTIHWITHLVSLILIHWTMIYQMDRTIQRLNNGGLYNLLNQEYIQHFKPLISLQLIEKSSTQLKTITSLWLRDEALYLTKEGQSFIPSNNNSCLS